MAGNNYEHKILDSLEIEGLEKDNQFIIDRLRVNLDGNTNTCIYEVKTHNANKEFKVPKNYWRQAQVEMYASKIHKLYIVAYELNEDDYINYFNKIDKNRLQLIEIEYDEDFIKNEYLPKLEILTECLKNGVFPKEWKKGNENFSIAKKQDGKFTTYTKFYVEKIEITDKEITGLAIKNNEGKRVFVYIKPKKEVK